MLIRVMAEMNTRWARDGLTADQAGVLRLADTNVGVVTHMTRLDASLGVLARISEVVPSFQVSVEGMWPCVYFIRAGDKVKIGRSLHPLRRLSQVRRAAPGAELVALYQTLHFARCEREEHKRFASDRIEGEWFRATEELLTRYHELTDGEPWDAQRETAALPTVTIRWKKWADFQGLTSNRQPSSNTRAAHEPPPPPPPPQDAPAEKKRESTPFGRGASPPAGEQASLVPDSPPDPSDPFDPDRLADVLGAEGREAKRAFVREHLDHLLAAARARLAERGVEEPTRAQVRSALLERLHAFWKQRAKGPRGGGIADDDTPSERETRWLKEAQARWLRKHGS